MRFANLDNAQSIFFERELERVKARAYEIEYKDLKFRELFSIDNEGGLGVDTQTVQVFDKVGMAKIIAGYSDDLPRADVSGREITTKIHTVGSSFVYNVQEIAAAQLANKPLTSKKAMACTRATEEKLNDIAFNGDDDAGLLGFLNNPNVTIGNVVAGGGGVDTEWSTKTPDEILFDINDMFSTVQELTNMKERASRLLLPVQQYNFIASAPRSSFSDTTIMAYIVQNSPYLNSAEDIVPLVEMKEAGPTGGDVMAVYNPDPLKIEMDIPYEQQFLNPQEVGLAFKVPSLARSGGLNVYFPLAVLMREGI